MKLRILPLLLFLSTLAAAQTSLDLAADPHYHLLIENDEVRVFALTLHTNESALVHYLHSFMVVTLQDGEVVMWQEGQSAIQSFQFRKGEVGFVPLSAQDTAKPVGSGIRNDHKEDFRNITVEFLNPKIGWASVGGAGISPPVDPQAKFANSAFIGGATISDVQLLAGDSFPLLSKASLELLIPVTDVDLQGAGKDPLRKSPGDAAWIPAGHATELVNAGTGPARFIIVEFQD
jgi:hypothetical protein